MTTNGPVGAVEDQRKAVEFSVNLSGQLIAAAVAILAVEAAYVSYVLGSRVYSGWFIPIAGIAAMAFIVSVYSAGKGITAARNSGFEGRWLLSEGKKQFNFQAVSLLIGLGAFGLMTLMSGPTKESELERRVTELQKELAKIQAKPQPNADSAQVSFHAIGQVGPFVPGVPSGGVELTQRILTLADDFNRTMQGRQPVLLVLVGSADKRPLRDDKERRFGSNAGLAQARAKWVESILVPKLSAKPLTTIVLDAGPSITGESALSDAALEADRVVRVYAISSGPAR